MPGLRDSGLAAQVIQEQLHHGNGQLPAVMPAVVTIVLVQKLADFVLLSVQRIPHFPHASFDVFSRPRHVRVPNLMDWHFKNAISHFYLDRRVL